MSKNFRKVQKIEELPSFLLKLSAIPEDVKFPPRATTNDLYLGPVFLGKCNENHPPLHSINFGTFRHTQIPFPAKESINNLFLPKTSVEKPVKKSKPFRLKRVLRYKHAYTDPHLHRCPGTIKAFVPEVKPPAIDLGESSSVIEGETVLEIPLYSLKKVCSGSTVPKFELVKFSDMQEKRKIFMPYNERISHIHFPKEFATVTVVGPTIPASLTITKLPSKRKAQSVENLLKTSNVKTRLKEETAAEKIDEVTKEPEEVDFSAQEGDSAIFSVKGSISTERTLEAEVTEEEEKDENDDDLQEVSTEQIGENIIETTEESDNEDTAESGEHSVKEIYAGEMEEIQEIGKNEEQLKENAEEPGN